MFEKQIAAREQLKLMVGLMGPSGSGKTYSALQLAYGITGDWKKITIADTENKSSLYYAGLGGFSFIDFNANNIPGGYSPANWIKLIEKQSADKDTEVLILDSITHEWEGKGGCLEMVDAAGKFNGWKMVTPLHRAFIDTMRNSRLHIIATMRSKQEYVIETNEKGKPSPKKVGTKANQRDGTDYEFGLVFDIEMSHFATSSKDRTGIFANRGCFQIVPAIGKELLAWAKTGKELPKSAGYDNNAADHKKWLQEQFNQLQVPKDQWRNLAQKMTGLPMEQQTLKDLTAMTGIFEPTNSASIS